MKNGHPEVNSAGRGEWMTPALTPMDAAERPVSRPTWWMRCSFALDAVPREVRASIVCLGYYELYVNGERVGDEPLAPSLSRLDRRGFEVVQDIADFLREGDNCIAIWCSSGWYLPNQFAVHEGMSPLLRVEVSRDKDGKLEAASDAEWFCRQSNRAVIGQWAWNNFGGEEVDARDFLPGWNRVGCDTQSWYRAMVVSAPPIEVCERTCPPNRIGETYPAQSVRKLDEKLFEVDFGTCLAGWVDIGFGQLAKDQTVKLRFYDLPADSERTKDHSYNQVSIHHACGDGIDRFENKFNYAGFRYMTIEGMDNPPELANMRALLVESALGRTSSFRCSNELFNRIHDLNVHTLRCLNLGGYSVDCPHRERLGYGADGQTALPAYLYTMGSAAFLRKWLVDWCDVYEPETGRISLTAPNHHAQHAPAWGGIVAPLAWSLYIYYGDRASMEAAFPVIHGHLRYLQTAVRGGVLRREALGSAFHADWVPPRRGMDTKNAPDLPMRELFNSCYLIYIWEIFVKICAALGRESEIPEAETCIRGLREGIHREFYNAEAGYYLMPEQAYQAMPLLAGVVPQELKQSVLDKLVGMIEGQGWHMDAGLPGTTLLLDLLADCNEHEVISRIYNQETYPGWGYMLASGATAIWEQWNGFWSQIHSCFAGPAAWFYSGLAGIRPDADGPGFASFILGPAFISDLDFVEACYDSAAGRIESSWHREDGGITWVVSIPEGSAAKVLLPLTASGLPLVNGAEVHDFRIAPNAKGEQETIFRLSAGRYAIRWTERAE